MIDHSLRILDPSEDIDGEYKDIKVVDEPLAYTIVSAAAINALPINFGGALLDFNFDFSASAKAAKNNRVNAQGFKYCTKDASIKCNQATHFVKLGVLSFLRNASDNSFAYGKKAFATTLDIAPMLNVPNAALWNRCYSLLNPLTLSATLANFAKPPYVFKIIPMPCIFVPAGPWKGADPNIMSSLIPPVVRQVMWWADSPGIRAEKLHDKCTLTCIFGGEFTVFDCGQDASSYPYDAITGLIGPDLGACLHNAIGILSNHVGMAASIALAACDSAVTFIETGDGKAALTQFGIAAGSTLAFGAAFKGLAKSGLTDKLGKAVIRRFNANAAPKFQNVMGTMTKKCNTFSAPEHFKVLFTNRQNSLGNHFKAVMGTLPPARPKPSSSPTPSTGIRGKVKSVAKSLHDKVTKSAAERIEDSRRWKKQDANGHPDSHITEMLSRIGKESKIQQHPRSKAVADAKERVKNMKPDEISDALENNGYKSYYREKDPKVRKKMAELESKTKTDETLENDLGADSKLSQNKVKTDEQYLNDANTKRTSDPDGFKNELGKDYVEIGSHEDYQKKAQGMGDTSLSWKAKKYNNGNSNISDIQAKKLTDHELSMKSPDDSVKAMNEMGVDSSVAKLKKSKEDKGESFSNYEELAQKHPDEYNASLLEDHKNYKTKVKEKEAEARKKDEEIVAKGMREGDQERANKINEKKYANNQKKKDKDKRKEARKEDKKAWAEKKAKEIDEESEMSEARKQDEKNYVESEEKKWERNVKDEDIRTLIESEENRPVAPWHTRLHAWLDEFDAGSFSAGYKFVTQAYYFVPALAQTGSMIYDMFWGNANQAGNANDTNEDNSNDKQDENTDENNNKDNDNKDNGGKDDSNNDNNTDSSSTQDDNSNVCTSGDDASKNYSSIDDAPSPSSPGGDTSPNMSTEPKNYSGDAYGANKSTEPKSYSSVYDAPSPSSPGGDTSPNVSTEPKNYSSDPYGANMSSEPKDYSSINDAPSTSSPGGGTSPNVSTEPKNYSGDAYGANKSTEPKSYSSINDAPSASSPGGGTSPNVSTEPKNYSGDAYGANKSTEPKNYSSINDAPSASSSGGDTSPNVSTEPKNYSGDAYGANKSTESKSYSSINDAPSASSPGGGTSPNVSSQQKNYSSVNDSLDYDSSSSSQSSPSVCSPKEEDPFCKWNYEG